MAVALRSLPSLLTVTSPISKEKTRRALAVSYWHHGWSRKAWTVPLQVLPEVKRHEIVLRSPLSSNNCILASWIWYHLATEVGDCPQRSCDSDLKYPPSLGHCIILGFTLPTYTVFQTTNTGRAEGVGFLDHNVFSWACILSSFSSREALASAPKGEVCPVLGSRGLPILVKWYGKPFGSCVIKKIRHWSGNL